MNKILYIITFLIISICISCQKYLDEKPNRSQVIPTTLNDFQAMMDWVRGMNLGSPSAGEIACDDVYVTGTDWSAQTSLTSRNAYIWSKDVFNDNNNNDWTYPYQAVLTSNVVLEGLEKIKMANDAGQQVLYNTLKGSALFYRSYAFYHLAQEFCEPFQPGALNDAPGISLRLSSDINQTSTRASIKATYDQFILDTKTAAQLLPITTLYKTRPCKAAAFALLARAYLSMEDYTHASLYADSSIQLNNKLIDFNSLNAALNNPVPQFNDEVLFHCNFGSGILSAPLGKVDSNLYKKYAINDLRKTIFFKAVSGGFSFYGSYVGTSELFGGLATDEMYLIRAEGWARKGNISLALSDINFLLSKRYKTGTFVPFTATTVDAVLNSILLERRKELVYRGTRWSDLRRLNRDARFAVTVQRIVNNTTYSLLPNDLAYVFPIPDKVIAATGMQQNPR